MPINHLVLSVPAQLSADLTRWANRHNVSKGAAVGLIRLGLEMSSDSMEAAIGKFERIIDKTKARAPV
jgi:hypothetical protein